MTRPGQHPRAYRTRRALPTLVLAACVLAACGSDRTGGPRGAPEEVVRAAPGRTFAEGSARVDAASPDATASGTVDFAARRDALDVVQRGSVPPQPELHEPVAVLDLVRGAVDVEPYGGVAVRGVSTFRYEVVVEVERALASTPPAGRPALRALAEAIGAPAFYGDVWVDGQGRVRRVQFPVVKTTKRPGSRDRRIPPFVTVDFFAFGRP